MSKESNYSINSYSTYTHHQFDTGVVMPCCLCGEGIKYGLSHNAEPVRSGRCCNVCNLEIVIPKRFGIHIMKIKDTENKNEKKNN